METSQLRKRMPVTSLTDPKIVRPAIGSAFAKLDPRLMMKNPVMFVVEVVAALTTVIFIRDWMHGGDHLRFTFQIIVWLWFTVLFANFAEAMAEGRGKAQAASLRQTREETKAKLIVDAKTRVHVPTPASRARARPGRAGRGRGHHPLRRRGDRGHRLGQRGGHHGRVRAGHSRVGRRPLSRHRRYTRRFRLAEGAYHRGTRLDLPRPHDCPGRRRAAAEDAERDRAEHSAGRHDHHLRVRHGDHPELCGVCRRARSRLSFSWRCS